MALHPPRESPRHAALHLQQFPHRMSNCWPKQTRCYPSHRHLAFVHHGAHTHSIALAQKRDPAAVQNKDGVVDDREYAEAVLTGQLPIPAGFGYYGYSMGGYVPQGEEIPFCNLQAADRNNDGVIDPLEYARAVDMGMLPGPPSQYSYSALSGYRGNFLAADKV